MSRHAPEIGLSSTLLAVTIPDGWLSYGGKFVFAIVLAAASSAISAMVSNYFTRAFAKKGPK